MTTEEIAYARDVVKYDNSHIVNTHSRYLTLALDALEKAQAEVTDLRRLANDHRQAAEWRQAEIGRLSRCFVSAIKVAENAILQLREENELLRAENAEIRTSLDEERGVRGI